MRGTILLYTVQYVMVFTRICISSYNHVQLSSDIYAYHVLHYSPPPPLINLQEQNPRVSPRVFVLAFFFWLNASMGPRLQYRFRCLSVADSLSPDDVSLDEVFSPIRLDSRFPVPSLCMSVLIRLSLLRVLCLLTSLTWMLVLVIGDFFYG